jgi:predicted nucleotidyltransferase
MIGLSEEELSTLQNVFSNIDNISQVILFGSRATGTNRKSSDVDLAIKGDDLGIDTLAKLKNILEEQTKLPYFFDIIIYDHITNQELKHQIDKYGVSIWNII